MNRHETAEARALIACLLSRPGCSLSVHDGEERTLSRSTDAAAVFAALGTTDADTLSVHAGPLGLGSFVLIYGNGPGELIADHSDNQFCESAWQHVQDTAVPRAYRA